MLKTYTNYYSNATNGEMMYYKCHLHRKSMKKFYGVEKKTVGCYNK